MNSVVFLNGAYIDKTEAKISADDRGFHFADGVYEVTKYYGGKPFRLADHLKRLENSLREVSINYPEFLQLPTVFEELLRRNDLLRGHAAVYLQISRGTHQRVHHFPPGLTPTVYAYAYAFPSFTQALEKGITVITAEDIRWLRCDIKSVSLLPNSMLYNKAVEQEAGECVLIRNGKVTEATHSSVIGVKNGVLRTHPLSNLILPGITRKVMLEIADKEGIPIQEEAITENELYSLDELIICGTGSEVMPVIQVNGQPVGNGKPGPVTRFLQDKFFELTGN
ncbi:MAG TPA: D-amino-acid transaminase [Prolixibacteraceae bacterium]|nr:D-amino-acid transaminase [Prolixibacteraceae bacterium]